jgi:hypothetical protein
MGQHGFTCEELRDIFNLDPRRPQDRSAIAALQASRTRQLHPTPSAAGPRLRSAARRLVNKRGRRAA